MATIIHLPIEIIATILKNDNISIEDIMNFSSTCKQFQRTILAIGNKFWEKKFYQRCPSAKKMYNTEKRKKIYDQLNFQEQIKEGLKYIKKIQYYVSLLNKTDDLSDTNRKELECLLRSLAEKSMAYYFVVDEINRIESQINILSTAYYFITMLRFLKQCRLLYKRNKFLKMPKRRQLLERLFIIVVQYFKPHVSYSIIKIYLNDITQEVLLHLKDNYPAHPIFSKPLEQFSFWREKDIHLEDNFWDETAARQIMRTLEEFIFSGSQDHKLYQLLKALDIEVINNPISECFKTYVLPIIYHSIARRLGICCFVMPFRKINNAHKYGIRIAWKPKYATVGTYMDLNNAEHFIQSDAPLSYPSNIIKGICNYRVYLVDHIMVLSDIGEQIFDFIKFRSFGYNYTFWEFRNLCEIIKLGEIILER